MITAIRDKKKKRKIQQLLKTLEIFKTYDKVQDLFRRSGRNKICKYVKCKIRKVR